MNRECPSAPILTEKVLLVIPAFRESRRLPRYLDELLPALAAALWKTRVLIVDDGSGPEECAKLQSALASRAQSLVTGNVRLGFEATELNRGKGAAIRRGWNAVEDESIIGFVDADGSIPAAEVVRMLDWMMRQPARPAVFASRIKMLGRTIHRRASRHYLGRVFATLASESLGLDCYDSQCGFKLLPRVTFDRIQGSLEENGFALDLELLVLLEQQEYPVIEFPIDWHDEPGSRVHLWRDGWRLIRAVRRLRKRRETTLAPLPTTVASPAAPLAVTRLERP